MLQIFDHVLKKQKMGIPLLSNYCCMKKLLETFSSKETKVQCIEWVISARATLIIDKTCRKYAINYKPNVKAFA